MSALLITGASGFLGSHLLKSLLAETTDKIVVLKRSFSNTARIEKELQNPRVFSYNIDQFPLENLPWEEIDIILHCATEYGRQSNSCSKVLQTNLLFPVQLLDLATKHQVRCFINTDSYFNKNHFSYSYLLDYSLSKKSLNLWLKYFSKKISILNLRLEHIYGPWDNADKFVEHMIQNIAVHPQKTLPLSLGKQTRDFIYVEDVCQYYLRAIKFARSKKFNFKHIDVGTGKETSIRDFVKTIKRLSKSPTKLDFGALPYREDEIMSSQADKPYPFPYTTVEQGIAKILACYRKTK